MQRFNSIVKIKVDTCIDCGRVKKIYSLKRCDYCYKIYSNKARQDKFRESNPELILEQKLLWDWYCKKVKELKWRCENCGDQIIDYDVKYNHWHVCHVLPKEHFYSIRTNDDNWWEGCNTCHTLYDNFLNEKDERLMHMRIFSVIIEKIKILKPFVSEHRRFNGLPEFILKLIN